MEVHGSAVLGMPTPENKRFGRAQGEVERAVSQPSEEEALALGSLAAPTQSSKES